MIRFRSIGVILTAVFAVVVGIALAAVMFLYADRQEESITRHNEQAMRSVTSGTIEGLMAIMLRGYAADAHDYVAGIKRAEGILEYNIVRVDGRLAFIDNETITAVNRRLARDRFPLHPKPAFAPRIIPADDPLLERANATRQAQFSYRTNALGERSVVLVEPIPLTQGCIRCHGSQNSLRGHVVMEVPLKPLEEDIRRARATALGFVAVAFLLTLGLVWLIARRLLTDPLDRLTNALGEIQRGHFSARVKETGGDEIGTMSRNFNLMADRLDRLQAVLSKEQGMLSAIFRTTGEGIVLADDSGRVVRANPAAITMLNKPESALIGSSLADLVDSPEAIADGLAHSKKSQTVPYRGRTLSISVVSLANGVDERGGIAVILHG